MSVSHLALTDVAERLEDKAGAASYGHPRTPEDYERLRDDLLALAARIREVVDEENALWKATIERVGAS